MLRKTVFGAVVAGFYAFTPLMASDLRFTQWSDAIGTTEAQSEQTIAASYEDQATTTILSDEVRSASWGQLTPCDIRHCCDASTNNARDCDASTCDGIPGRSKSLGLGWCSRFAGIVKPSEHCYDDFISPITNPFYFEDPRQLTEVRALFLNQELPSLFGIQGGSVQIYALQMRARLTERLSLIVVKDGFLASQNNFINDGGLDLSAGLKYSLYRDAAADRLLSIGTRFTSPIGTKRTAQGYGDGVLDVFMSGGSRIGRSGHYVTSSGFILPMNSQAQNQIWYWSNHLDKRLGTSKFYGLVELNWYRYMKSGSFVPVPVQAGDLFNVGATGIAGTNIVTNAYGLRYKPNRNLESGVAYEFPVAQNEFGIMKNRFTADLIFRF